MWLRTRENEERKYSWPCCRTITASDRQKTSAMKLMEALDISVGLLFSGGAFEKSRLFFLLLFLLATQKKK